MSKQGVALLRKIFRRNSFPLTNQALSHSVFLRILPGFVHSTDSGPVPEPFFWQDALK